jgi:hypothetical protein
MPGEVTIFKGGEIVAHSKNLRGLTDYASKNGPPEYIFQYELAHGYGKLVVQWPNGAKAGVNFNSYRVMKEWVSARYSWRGATVYNFPLGSCAADEQQYYDPCNGTCKGTYDGRCSCDS